MAKVTNLEWHIGEDRLWEHDVTNVAETVATNILGFTLSWMIKRSLDDHDTRALVTKTTGAGQIAIAGTYNSDPDLNEQRATVTALKADNISLPPGDYFWELKRTDTGFNVVLGKGEMQIKRGLHRT